MSQNNSKMFSFSSGDLRSCLSLFATGVTVVTSSDDVGNFCGITINSFNSVSLDPPMILFSLGKKSARFDTFTNASKFIVNILSQDQMDLSIAFSKRSDADWAKISFLEFQGIPVFKESLSFLYCSPEFIHEGGDHKIIIARVRDIKILNSDKPLLYYKSKYHKIGESL